MPARYDQDTKDDHRKEITGGGRWLPHGIGRALQRGMEWVMYTAAGLLSGAPRPMSIPDAIRAAAAATGIAARLGCQPLADRAETIPSATPRTTAS